MFEGVGDNEIPLVCGDSACSSAEIEGPLSSKGLVSKSHARGLPVQEVQPGGQAAQQTQLTGPRPCGACVCLTGQRDRGQAGSKRRPAARPNRHVPHGHSLQHEARGLPCYERTAENRGLLGRPGGGVRTDTPEIDPKGPRNTFQGLQRPVEAGFCLPRRRLFGWLVSLKGWNNRDAL